MTDYILLAAAAQTVLLTAFILHRRRRLHANRFLGAMTGLYAVILFYLFAGEQGLLEPHPLPMVLIMGSALCIAPLHFLYARSLIRPEKPSLRKYGFHFTPFFLFEAGQFLIAIRHPDRLSTRLERMASGGLTPEDSVFNWLILIQGGIYLFLTLRLLRAHSRRVEAVFSSPARVRLTWLRNVTRFACLVLFAFLVENLFFLSGINLTDYFTLTSTLTAVYIFAIGYLGLLRAEIVIAPETAGPMQTLAELDSTEPGRGRGEKYIKSGLGPDRAAALEAKLLHFMETDTPYRDSDLTLTRLASRLSVSPHNLSEVINTRLNRNFFDFVNEYRVEQVKRDLTDPKKRNLTLLAVAFDAGFNSKISFNTLFKKQTGLTPSEFRRKALRF